MKIIFHLGHSRAASTYLQYYIFPIHKDINYIGTRYYRDPSEIKINQKLLNRICQNFVEPDIIYDDLKKEIPKILNHFDEKKLNIISSESYLSIDNAARNFKDIKFLEKIIKEKYKNASVEFLIILRNQYDAIKSLFYHSYPVMSQALGINKFEKLINCFDKNLNINYETSRFFLFSQNYDFLQTHNKLNNFFNNHKIHYLFYEDFKNNRDKFILEFNDILGLNSDYTKSLFLSKKIINKGPAHNTNVFYHPLWQYNLSKNFLFNKIKKYIPKSIKNLLLKLSFKKDHITPEKNTIYRNKVTAFYKESNKLFFNLIKKQNIYN